MPQARLSHANGTVRRVTPRRALVLALLVAGAGHPGPAAALPPPQPVSPFIVTGFIKEATLAASDALAGGSITVNDHVITVPRNTIVLMPASFLTWQELFRLAPAPYGPTQTGLAMADSPAPLTTWEATVQGNRVGDEYIAGLVAISQQSLMTGQGFINFIDYVTGEMRVGGIIGDRTTGTRVRINDPLGRFGRQFSPDVRFTIDEDNPNVRAETGFPMCVPRFDPATKADPLCPQTNRPIDGATGTFAKIFTMSNPATNAAPDARQQAPFEVGDFVTYAGELMKDGPQPLTGPLPPRGQTFVAAWTVVGNVGIFTFPFSDPVYVAVDVSILGVGGAPAPGLPQEATVRTRFEGFATDASPGRVIDLFAVDVDPCTGATSERSWGSIDIDAGPPLGAVKGRWRFRPPTKALSLPASGTFLPPARELRARMRSASGAAVANGLTAGQYRAPVAQFLFPENLGVGNPPVPLNLQDFPFLARGSGPWAGGGPNPIPSGVVGQLSPWPGQPAPALAVCNPGVPTAPTADARAVARAAAGAGVILDGAASSDPNGLALSFAWTQTAGPTVALSNPAVARPSFIAPSVTGGTSLRFSLVVTDTAGLSSAPASVTIAIDPPVTVTLAPFVDAGLPQTVLSGTVVQLNGTATVDLNTPPLPLTLSWTQVAPLSPTPVLTGAGTATPTFTAPIVPPGAPLVMTFHLVATNSAGLGATSQVNVTVSPVAAPVANAGPPQTVLQGTTVTLNGLASADPQGLPLTYSWKQIDGTPVTLSGANTASPTFVAPSPPSLCTFQLVVSNGFLSSAPASVAITGTAGVDSVRILTAVYRVAKQRLTVTAFSSVPSAVLTLQGFGGPGGVQLTPVNGVLTADVVGVPAPTSVTVTSSLGGSATSPLTQVR